MHEICYFSVRRIVYFLNLQVTNRAGVPVKIMTSDLIPREGLRVGANVIAKIKKKVTSQMPITLQALDATSNKLLFINSLSNITLTPTENELAFVPLDIRKTRK